MAIFVADASVTLPWCFEDEATSWTDGLLDRLRTADSIAVPAHWPTEILNGMLMAVRRKRIPPDRPALFWDELSLLPIEVEPPLWGDRAKATLSLCDRYGLTVYDSAYLELAKRRGLALATIDDALRQAARREGLLLLDGHH